MPVILICCRSLAEGKSVSQCFHTIEPVSRCHPENDKCHNAPSPFPSWPRGQTIAIINRLGCISLAFPLLTFAGSVVPHSERGLTSLAQLTDERLRLLRSRRETGAISVSLLQSIGSVGSCPKQLLSSKAQVLLDLLSCAVPPSVVTSPAAFFQLCPFPSMPFSL